MHVRFAVIVLAACSAAASAQSGGYHATPLPVGEHSVILPPATDASFDISWNTIDGGGRTLQSGSLTLDGTLGQPDAGIMTFGAFELRGGFVIHFNEGPVCYPNCDNSTAAPILNINDFQCFLNQYTQGAAYANCDGSTTTPILNVIDFQCFLNSYAAGCS